MRTKLNPQETEAFSEVHFYIKGSINEQEWFGILRTDEDGADVVAVYWSKRSGDWKVKALEKMEETE